VILPIRASCSYPVYLNNPDQDLLLVDGAMCMEVPAALVRKMGATHVIAVGFAMAGPEVGSNNMLQVVNRCFQILQNRGTWPGAATPI